MKLLAAVAALCLTYVLPVDRVVLEIATEHKKTPPLRVEATLQGIGDAWPERVRFELHPDFGFRLESDRGNRWLFHAAGGVEGSRLPAPPWIPDLRLLTLGDAVLLSEWVAATGVDPGSSELARCSEQDCFVLGGRDARAQIWVEKDRFEILEQQDARGRRTRYGGYREWEKVRFPKEIQIFDAYGSVATFVVESVTMDDALRGEHFSTRWVSSDELPLQ